MSAPSDPAKKTLSKKAGAKVLAGLLSRHMQAVSKEWSGILGSSVSCGVPTVAEVPAAGLGKLLPWPMTVIPLALEGGFPGRFAVLVTPAEAGILTGKEVPAEGAVPTEAVDAFYKLFVPFCAAAVQAYAKEGAPALRVTQEMARLAADAEKLKESDVAADGWLADVKLALAGGKAVQLRVLIPAAPGSALAEAHHVSEEHAGQAKGKKGTILVVDDQYSIRTLIRRHLEKEGFAIVECSNGEEAVQHLAKKDKPVAMISDVMMPGMDGFELCRRLREMPDGKQLPVIMCTGKGQRRDVVEALQAGANDYIVKPFTREILLAKLAKVMAPPSQPQA